ncbi:TauD/TfdA family dioxygenase [Frankia sp. CNm7]|uniref:TauD/TfdA family dioxygenase n=1 Tax=Frankia nepalensis TaxID=1836974 RepID=A0A937RL13_9ACTN|nr:TauD/TfdA family dioxygenase [Frankia nepalensis]MBL7498441.1 TauD/TfdA family dioxygenase [Frankia nepalensis]MBL7509464.1 TauD/TfdA family dioxygenase [Frankia nepalensis]MBL7520170.1 TauD/TfdA family dioxygenase [Frankia nepalensis]MBL7629274.1 TauD/TfdA family dioxygenase [Frankia nepalensis]
MTATITCEPLAATVGAAVSGVDADQLAKDDTIAASVLEALERYGVLVFRGLNLDPDNQIAFCRRLGEIDYEYGHHPVAGIYRVTLDRSKNSSADYLKATFHWHMDGCMPLHGEPPQKATILSAKQVAASGGETEFASTYAGHDALSDDEKERFAALRVVHTFEASQRTVYPDPTPEQLARWRARPSSTHPLVWTRRTGRRSLVIGAHASHVVGMDLEEGRALLGGLLDRATRPERAYRHHWSVGDTVIWDNTGVVHRAAPYDPSSPRELLRTTVFGDEPIR